MEIIQINLHKSSLVNGARQYRTFRMAMVPTQPNIQQVLGTVSCPRDKFLGHEADQQPLPSA